VYRVLERVKFLGLCIVHNFVVGRGVMFFVAVLVSVPVLLLYWLAFPFCCCTG
jgi:hypothetical protein